MAEWFANMNIALHRIDTAGKTTQKPAAAYMRCRRDENTKVHIALREFPR